MAKKANLSIFKDLYTKHQDLERYPTINHFVGRVLASGDTLYLHPENSWLGDLDKFIEYEKECYNYVKNILGYKHISHEHHKQEYGREIVSVNIFKLMGKYYRCYYKFTVIYEKPNYDDVIESLEEVFPTNIIVYD